MSDDRYFEDYAVGQVREFGDYEMTEAEILDFARRFDPQSFHTDPEAAKGSVFGGLIASGWHTASATMRMLADNAIASSSSMGSPGVDELRWVRPVRPGDRLRVRTEIEETRRSRSKPDRGVVRTRTEVRNQRDEVVMTMRGMGMFRLRHPER